MKIFIVFLRGTVGMMKNGVIEIVATTRKSNIFIGIQQNFTHLVSRVCVPFAQWVGQHTLG
jgi:hypothetical protein